ncbi:hypothetical protein C8Q75DRAFT_40291 [Abortiporus biennis]|nr:hypothetical protein C8Q75DRAFT_40291 [Abortiporus biennis]
MSSRRRPERSATPRWRSLSSTTKPLPATSVSLIFAQPLQGSPLRSAVDNLPAVGIDDSASFMSEMSRKRERVDSSVSSVAASEGSLTGAKEVSNKRSRSGSIANSSKPEVRHDGVVIDLTDNATCSYVFITYNACCTAVCIHTPIFTQIHVVRVVTVALHLTHIGGILGFIACCV